MEKSFDKEIIRRTIAALNLKKVNDIARIFNISQQNLNGYIKRGTFLKLVEGELYKRNININWITTGQGTMLSAPTNTPVNEAPAEYRETLPSIKDPSKDYLTMTAAIIGTPSIFSTALKSNIEAFHSGIKLQQELAAARAMLTIHDEQLKSQRERMNTLEDLIRRKEDKKAG